MKTKGKTKVFLKSVEELLEIDKKLINKEDPCKCPLDLSVIPNYMGINLCSVDSIGWQRQGDNQLTSITIYFIPAEEE